MENLADNLISFLVYPPEAGWLFILKAVFILVSIALVVAIIYCSMRCSYLKFMLFIDASEILTYMPFGL
ncbi:MAG: hypothetical protein Q8P08_00145 [bacterium]|nr:hypothetical protein [bacterium]